MYYNFTIVYCPEFHWLIGRHRNVTDDAVNRYQITVFSRRFKVVFPAFLDGTLEVNIELLRDWSFFILRRTRSMCYDEQREVAGSVLEPCMQLSLINWVRRHRLLSNSSGRPVRCRPDVCHHSCMTTETIGGEQQQRPFNGL